MTETVHTGETEIGHSVPTGDAVIEVRDLRMSYAAKEVLAGVDFVARRGEVLVLLGPNGMSV